MTINPETLYENEFYWQETYRPLVCLLFLSPLLIFYEWSLWQAGAEQSALYRNGADYWMRNSSAYLGLAQPLLLPMLVIAILMVWHNQPQRTPELFC